jgi:hypothetical protein
MKKTLKINKATLFDAFSAIALLTSSTLFTNYVVPNLLALNIALCILFISFYYLVSRYTDTVWTSFFRKSWRVMGISTLIFLIIIIISYIYSLILHDKFPDEFRPWLYLVQGFASIMAILPFTPGLLLYLLMFYATHDMPIFFHSSNPFLIYIFVWTSGIISSFTWAGIWLLLEMANKKLKSRLGKSEI